MFNKSNKNRNNHHNHVTDCSNSTQHLASPAVSRTKEHHECMDSCRHGDKSASPIKHSTLCQASRPSSVLRESGTSSNVYDEEIHSSVAEDNWSTLGQASRRSSVWCQSVTLSNSYDEDIDLSRAGSSIVTQRDMSTNKKRTTLYAVKCCVFIALLMFFVSSIQNERN